LVDQCDSSVGTGACLKVGVAKLQGQLEGHNSALLEGVGVAHVTRDECESEVSAFDATPHLVQQLASPPEPLTRPLLIEKPVVEGARGVSRGKPGTALVPRRKVPLVCQLPQAPGLLEVVVHIAEVSQSVMGLRTRLDGQRRLQVARCSVEVASTHRLPTGDNEAVS